MNAFVLGFVLITAAQVISYGRFQPHALILITLGIAAVFWGIFIQAERERNVFPKRQVLVMGAAAVLLPALVHNPLTYSNSIIWLVGLRLGVIIAILLLATYVLLPLESYRSLAGARFVILLLLAVAARIAVPFASPFPGEDVWVVQQEGAAALLAGQDPYSVSYTQIFSPEFYKYLGYTSGFHYSPLTLAAITPAYALLDDIRWAYILCELFVLAAVYLIIRHSNHIPERSDRELVLWLWGLNPVALLIIEHSWSEPLGAALLALFVLAALQGRKWLPAAALALFFSFKQYTLVFFPLLLFLPQAVPLLICFAAVNVISYAPWLVIGIEGLLASLTEPWRANPRPDALSYAALWMNARHLPFPGWITAASLLGGIHLSLRKIPRSLRGMMIALFIVHSLLFLTAKQSFCNYYYLLSFYLILILLLPAETNRE